MQPWSKITHYAGFDWAHDHHEVVIVNPSWSRALQSTQRRPAPVLSIVAKASSIFSQNSCGASCLPCFDNERQKLLPTQSSQRQQNRPCGDPTAVHNEPLRRRACDAGRVAFPNANLAPCLENACPFFSPSSKSLYYHRNTKIPTERLNRNVQIVRSGYFPLRTAQGRAFVSWLVGISRRRS